MSKIIKKSFLGLSVLFFASLIYIIALYPYSKTEAGEIEVTALTGYAWSSNIGWISFSCENEDPQICDTHPDYDVHINLSIIGDNMSGYAWSLNIGWINFDPTSGYPELPSYSARINAVAPIVCPSALEVNGWIRALSNGGGWDGWIKMAGTADNGSHYGVCVSSDLQSLVGYAWGGDTVGWIQFDPNLNSIKKVNRLIEVIPQ